MEPPTGPRARNVGPFSEHNGVGGRGLAHFKIYMKETEAVHIKLTLENFMHLYLNFMYLIKRPR